MKSKIFITKKLLSLAIIAIVLLTACQKTDSFRTTDMVVSNATNASSYSADVIDKWITMQLRLDRDAVGIPNVAFFRYYAYSGIAALESLTPGLPKMNALTDKWNGLTGLPQAGVPKNYYWPASVNAA